MKKQKLQLSDLIPRTKIHNNYDKDIVENRQNWLKNKIKQPFSAIFPELDYSIYTKNIENPIGVCQVPLAVVGPLFIQGDYAKGNFYIPFATTQGALVESYQIGSFILTESGGVNVKVIKDQIDIDPVFTFNNIKEANIFYTWINNKFSLSKANSIVRKSTKHGKILTIKPYQVANKVFLQITFFTADAMGLNLMTIATNNLCMYFYSLFPKSNFYLRSNLTSDKKSSHINFQNSYGKEVQAEAILSSETIEKYFKVKPKALMDVWSTCFLATYQAGVLGHNAHVANAVAAIYLATGQDIAQVANAANALTYFELRDNNSLYISLKIPSLPVATVGGGTYLPHQKEALEIIDCVGKNKAKKLAEIICASALCGEIALMGALANNNFANTDKRLKERTKK